MTMYELVRIILKEREFFFFFSLILGKARFDKNCVLYDVKLRFYAGSRVV